MDSQKAGYAVKKRNSFITYFKTGGGGVLIALIVMFVGMSFASKAFFTQLNLTNLVKQICSNALLAFGMTMCLITGFIDLSVGAHVAFSGVVMVVVLNTGLSIWPTLLIVLLLGLIVGGTNGFVYSRTEMPPYIVTLAMQNVLRGAAYLVAGQGGSVRCYNNVFFNYANGYVFDVIPNPVIIVLVVAVILYIVMSRTVFGRHMYAVGGNKDTALYSGVDVKNVRFAVYAISGLLAALCGTIVASRVFSGQPSVGEGMEGEAIASAVLGGVSFNGGRGSIIGTLIGILIIGVLGNGMNLLEISYYWQLVVKGLVIASAVYFDTVKRKKTK